MQQVRMASKWVDDDQVLKSNMIPTTMISEAKIAEEAPLVVEILKQHKALDLLETLGLSSYFKEK